MGKFPIESAHFAIPSYGAHMLREIAILLRYSESMVEKPFAQLTVTWKFYENDFGKLICLIDFKACDDNF